MMQLQQLSKSYGNKQVLQQINLNLEAGKVYGIAGANGAGKTTLFRCIAGLEDYNGLILTPSSPIIGFLPTNPYFLSKITGWEYLKLLCVARGISREDFKAKNVFQLPLNQYASNYSTGMKKKLALLGLLLQNNDLFILDEPFNGVDIQSNLIIIKIIEQLRQQNKTILIASHIFSTLNDTCDEIHLLENGRFVQKVEKQNFKALHEKMKQFILGDRLDDFFQNLIP